MTVFSFTDYREYLLRQLGDGKRTGQRQRLAEALNCQAAHLSQVLNGKNHLSVEHAFGVNRFFGHTEKEAEYFLNIVQTARAGTPEAREYFQKKALKLKEQSLKIQDKITSEKRELSREEQAVYYGDAFFAQAHVATSLPRVKTLQDLSTFLDVELDELSKVVNFLIEVGLVVRKKDELTTGPGHTHLGIDSPHIKKHHMNLRSAGMRAVERGLRPNNLHYATYYTLSKADAFRIKEAILNLIDQNLKIIAPSKEEVMYCNIIDFFEIGAKKPS